MTALALFLVGMTAAIPLALLGDYVMSVFADDARPLPRFFRPDAWAIAVTLVVVVLVLGAVQQSDERAAMRAIASTSQGTSHDPQQ